MLSFFRRLTQSKLGVIITFGVLIVIALAFAAGDVTGLGNFGSGGLKGGDVATVGKADVTTADLRGRVQNEMENARQQQPTLDMKQFVALGGLDGTLERAISGIALEQFGVSQGMVVSKRSIDGQIASIPAFQGINGKFDQTLYERLLADRKLTDTQIRGDFAREMLAQQLTLPTVGATQVPVQLALPYASLLLEKRAGQIGVVPIRAMGTGATPTDAELATFYQRNVARYTVPARRVARYALVTTEQVKARAVPSDAEIAAAYQADRARYAPTEKRTITQVVVADQAGANALAAKVKAGTAIAEAARAAGLEPSTQTAVEKTAYAGTSSPAIADAAFAAQRGAVLGPLKGPLGWTVVRVDAIEQVAGRTLAQARGEIATALVKQKTTEALAKIHDAIDDSLSNNATFDEVIADQKLTPATTPALLASGIDPDAPATKPDQALTPILAAAFAAEEGDAPQMVQTNPDGSFAVVGLGRVVASAPRPLAQVRADVVRDFTIDRARAAARRVAGEVLAKVNKGTPLAQALAQSGVSLPPIQPMSAARAQIAANPQGVPPALALMFSMAQGTAKLLEAPQQGGWLIVKLDRIQPASAVGNQGIINATRGDMGRMAGREYVEQFARAARAQVGVKTDPKALARVRAELTGDGAAAN